ncbi:aldo/keto reductase, partial [Streptomyces eurythermus]
MCRGRNSPRGGCRRTRSRLHADMLKTFWEAGGTLVDTADVYGDGEAEYLLG